MHWPPVTENAFVVDPGIQEITIIASKKSADRKIYLQAPHGRRIDCTFESDSIKWFLSGGSDMITLTRPTEGNWNKI